MCGDWHLAEDLVQTTLAKMYVGWGKVRRADVPEAYAGGPSPRRSCPISAPDAMRRCRPSTSGVDRGQPHEPPTLSEPSATQD